MEAEKLRHEWFIPVKPTPKGRPRFCIRKGGPGKRVFGVAVTPEATRNSEADIRFFLHAHLSAAKWEPLEGALEVELELVFERPKSVKNRRYHVTKPDLDNCAKLVCDAANGLVWHDDSQICDLKMTKRYRREGEESFIGIRLAVREVCSAKENNQGKFTLSRRAPGLAG